MDWSILAIMIKRGWWLLLLVLVSGCYIGRTPTPAVTATVTVTSSPVIPTLTASPEASPTREVICWPSAFMFGYSELYADPGLTDLAVGETYPVFVHYLDPVTVLESAVDDSQQTWAYKIRTASGEVGWVPFFVLPVVCE